MRISEMIVAWAVRWWCVCLATCDTTTDYENNSAVNRFRDYLRINTTSEGGDLAQAVEFWKEQAASLELPVSVYEYYSGKPIVVITWEGSDPSLPSIMLNSHMDVVPADETGWIHPPFEAYMEENGDIYGRGTQDMKSVSIQYFEAIKLLIENNVSLARTIHMTLMPDEELGGSQGMKAFVETDDFGALEVGFSLDEGMAYPNGSYIDFFAEKTSWQVSCSCLGPGGHGSTMPVETATGKALKVMEDFQNYRDAELALITGGRDIGTVTTVNLNILSGGTALNTIPDNITLIYDIRLAAVDINGTAMEEMVQKYTDGNNCSHNYIMKDPIAVPTTLDDSNVYWVAFRDATDAMDMQVLSIISPGGSDGRYVRTKGIPVLGFSPMPNTPYLLHTVNEYLNAQTFLDGIDIYYNILRRVANA